MSAARRGVNAKGELHSFDHAGISVLGGLTRMLMFYGTLTTQVGGSVPVEAWSFERFNSAE
jgi:hypothetical protein